MKSIHLVLFKMNGYQMITSEHELVKQEIRKRLVVLYAKGILIFLQWKVVLCTPMLPVRSTKNTWLRIASVLPSIYFLTSCASQVPEKVKQQYNNTGTMKEMVIINQEWCYQCRDHVVSAIFTWKNKMQVHDTIWNCSLVQIWIVESYQFIAILFFIIGWRLKFHATKMSDGWLTHDFRTMKPTFWKLDTFILNFWRDPMLIISFKI